MEYEITPITERYIEAYHRCLDLVARERKFLGFIKAPPLDSSKLWVRTNVDRGAPYFIALSGNEVIGWCDIGLYEREGFTHRGTLGMGVHPNYRGKGIGKALLSKALERARRVGLERVELEVFASNTVAVKLYKQFGFKEEGRKTRARKLDSHYDDIILMVLFL